MMKKNGSFLALVISLALICSLLVVGAALADGIVKVTQMDASNFPEITIYVSVTDEHGQPVGGLGQDDFQVTEDGLPVMLEDFAGPGDLRTVDIVFVFDTTTSMVEEVNGMKRTSLAFAEKLEESGLDYNLGLVDFGDVINRVEQPDGRLTENAQQFKAWINQIQLAGGGVDIPEFSLGALQGATRMSLRDEALKIFILITDAPPHHYGDPPDDQIAFNDPTLTLESTLQQLSETNITAYIIAQEHSDYFEIVEASNGQFFNIDGGADFTTIIDQIGGLIATQYRLVYLSARPSHDGTRRHIEVTVGEATGTSTYLEQHLVNIRSNGVIALLLFVPLLVALLLPTAIKRRSQSAAAINRTDQPGEDSAEPDATPPSHFGAVTPPSQCLHCDNPLRLGAKFCAGCGQAVATQQAHPATCSRCSKPLKPGVKFCAHCGVRV